MSDLPEGWDEYSPNQHERTGEPSYERARVRARERAQQRRAAFGRALAELRRARALTQTSVAESLGIGQGEVSRIEHQADLLLSTFARYIDGVGGALTLVIRFADGNVV